MILVCGGAGYIGSHTNKQLNREGYETVVFDNLIYGHKEAVKWGRFVQGDLCRVQDIENVFQTYEIEAVFHFAAYAYVGESVLDPEKYYANNVVNTLNLLHVMKKYHCRQLIFSSTCAVYGEPDSVPVTEDMPLRPVNPYGKTKLTVEQILMDYEKAYGMRFAALRYFNAAGADPAGEVGESHDPETHIIPLVLDAAAAKSSCIQIFGTDYATMDGSCIRDYIHVSDLADAHIRALHYLENGGESGFFNLGNETGVSVLEIVAAAEKVTGNKIPVKKAGRRAGDPAILIGSSRKAEKILGWIPKYADIETMIRHAWLWHEHARF